MGFGANSRVHTTKLVELSTDLPIVIEMVDNAEKIQRLIQLDKVRVDQHELPDRHGAGTHAAQSLMNLATIRFRTGKYDESSKLFRQLAVNFPKSRLLGAAQLSKVQKAEGTKPMIDGHHDGVTLSGQLGAVIGWP